jgi:hypothetical protein
MNVRIRDDHDDVGATYDGVDLVGAAALCASGVVLEVDADRVARARPQLGRARQTADDRDA